MARPDPFAAQLLEQGAGGFAGFASSLLLDRHAAALDPAVSERDWRTHLAQRVLELAAAVRTGEPEIFVARAQWTRSAAAARDQSDDGIRAGLECLHEVLSEKLPSTAARAVEPHLAAALDAFEHPVAPTTSDVDAATAAGKLSLRYLEKSLEGDARGAVDLLLAALGDGMAVEEIYRGVLVPAQREVGRLWHQGELGVGEEHLVTATTKRAMSVLCQRGTAAASTGYTVVSASVAGNIHDLGTRMVSDFFELAGWRAVCLGADVPVSEVAASVTYFDADLLVLSATLSTHLRAVADTILAVRENGADLPILVGGPAFEDAAETWNTVGADGFSNEVGETVETGRNLVERH